MGKLTERLNDASRSGVYRTTRVDALDEAVQGTRLDCSRISLEKIDGKEGLLKKIAAELAFPSWFGANWDALEDCLADLSWRTPQDKAHGKTQGHLLVIDGFEGVPNDDLGILIDVLASSAEFWSGRGTPFFAVFVDPRRLLGLPDLFRER